MSAGRVLHSETRAAVILRVALGASAFVIAVLAVLLPADLQVRIILGFTAAANVLLLLALHSLTIEVREDALELRFGVGLLRRRYPIEKIASAASRPWSWLRGAGVRVGLRSTAYLVAPGEVIELQLVSGWRILFTCADSRRLLQALEAAGVPTAASKGR